MVELLCGTNKNYYRGVLIIEETWKPISGYEGYYEVSNIGNVRALKRKIPNGKGGFTTLEARDMYLRENKDGYYVVKLSKYGNSVWIPVHRLVASAFIGEMSIPGMEVNHIDFDRKNNDVENLEWVTHLDNVQKSVNAGHYVGKFGEENPNYGNHKLHERFMQNPELTQWQSRPGAQNGRARPVIVEHSITGDSKEFMYIRECAKWLQDLGVTKNKIERIALRIVKAIKENTTYCGYYFKFI